jgi:hypothetical protein
MKKLFLLAGMMLCFVLVQAMGVVEPPGKEPLCNIIGCQTDVVGNQAIDNSVVYSYEMPVSVILLTPCLAVENAEQCYTELIPGITSTDLLFSKFETNFIAVARSGVLLITDFLSNYNFALATLNLNFDGNQDRFY